MKQKRITRQTLYMKMAELVSLRGTCNRKHVGAILVNPSTNRIVALGYNGSHHGSPHCSDVGCLISNGHCVRTTHAEVNAVLNLEKKYDQLICYTTDQPCINCFKVLAGANIKSIFYLNPYEDKDRDELNSEININMVECHFSDETDELIFQAKPHPKQ